MSYLSERASSPVAGWLDRFFLARGDMIRPLLSGEGALSFDGGLDGFSIAGSGRGLGADYGGHTCSTEGAADSRM